MSMHDTAQSTYLASQGPGDSDGYSYGNSKLALIRRFIGLHRVMIYPLNCTFFESNRVQHGESLYDRPIQTSHWAIQSTRADHRSLNCPVNNTMNQPIIGQFIGPLVRAVQRHLNQLVNSLVNSNHRSLNRYMNMMNSPMNCPMHLIALASHA